MLTRRVSVALLLVLVVAGCAAPQQADASGSSRGVTEPPSPGVTESAPSSPGSAPLPSSPSSPDVIDLPVPSAKPGPGATQTISGTVTAGVEPNCRLLTSGGSSYLLLFKDSASRSAAAIGKTVTLVGRSDPSLMTTCMQGVPFVVTSVSGG
ncbi:hypothetical protein HH310_39370 [Actinoplanes sp. TBRC 11911]|uniref:hypothetical protein n=1 Tax=Actinoplanes sp. TBRC 11911 TaxID=2729386 RepID=UPI00145C43BB|nr:hypothetical protein [Actinoplanes sp. TBRC 11911]NMO57221.1 hypothetical protein [Actinoplanes sp. TBRC 11911]